ncbi:hypothetical protein TrST_g9011 [Triparma strigata]|uniref:Ribokinase n=1 Tax=Triparma strigata TaxID=1606541 RepID=A0A9W7BL82_9STRA|nr:hypothetical protein TrST_g9011 [Triparma strigata]
MSAPMSLPPLTIVGSINVDLTFYCNKFPSAGETINGVSFSKAFGGKGANQAAMSGLLNPLGSTLISKVGSDTHGTECLQNLTNYNVSTSPISKTSTPTGTACIQVDSTGENKIVVIPGANSELSEEDVIQCEDYIKNGSGLICQLEVPPSTVLKAMSIAKVYNKSVYFNPSPVIGLDVIGELLKLTDVCVCNRGELEVVSGLKTGSREEVIEAGKKLCEGYGIEKVVVTLGWEGSVCVGKDNVVECGPADLGGEVVDCVGAGDCFLATVAYELECGRGEEEAMRRANEMAGRSIMVKGAMTSYKI